MAKRPLDQMIGFIGGAIGIIMGAVGYLYTKFPVPGAAGVLSGVLTLVLFSLIGLFGAFIVTSRKKDGGMIMIVIGLAGLIALSNPYTWVPFAIILIAGVIARF